MRDADVHSDAECRRGMRDSGEEGRGELEMGPGSRTEWGGWRSRFRMPHATSALASTPAFLFCILHRGEIPYPAFISPLPTLPLKGAGFARWPLLCWLQASI